MQALQVWVSMHVYSVSFFSPRTRFFSLGLGSLVPVWVLVLGLGFRFSCRVSGYKP